MKSISLGGVLLLALVGAGIAGCHGGDVGDGLKPDIAKPAADLSAAAKRVGGNYDQLTAAEKTQALSMAGGSEAQAKSLVSLMAHPPSEMNAGRMHGSAAGPPPAPGQ